VPQISHFKLHLVAASTRLLVPDSLLEEERDVVEDGGNDDDYDGGARSRQRANLAPQRHADRDVAVNSHQNDHPDGHVLRDRRQRPDVRLEVRERGVECAPGVAAAPLSVRVQVMDRFHRLDEHAGDQVDNVDYRQGLQQPVGGAVLVAIASQDDERQRVADETDETEQADKAYVNDDSERHVASAGGRCRRGVGTSAALVALNQVHQHVGHVPGLSADVPRPLVWRNVDHRDHRGRIPR